MPNWSMETTSCRLEAPYGTTVSLEWPAGVGCWFVTCEAAHLYTHEFECEELAGAKREALRVALLHLGSTIEEMQSDLNYLLRASRAATDTSHERPPPAIDSTGLHRALRELTESDDDT